MSDDYSTDIRPLVHMLGKPPESWQRRDLVDLCVEQEIRVINFRYPSFDGKLRELRLPVRSRRHLDRLLAGGERVDGSSLFPGLFGAGASDLYAVPVYRWAFLNPWTVDELDIVCRFAGPDGLPAPQTPDNVLAAAAESLTADGTRLLALAELEVYLILDRRDDRFTGKAQRNYHQSAPYLHGRALADEILRTAAEVIGAVKYCHSEVGYIDRLESSDPELDGRRVEQYELELDLMPIEDLGTWLTVARWLIRAIADQHGASATFVPKLDQDMAGSGMHLHLALERGGKNVVLDAEGELSGDALRMLGGLLGHAAPLTAFGNTVASSYLRLVPGQEAPTRICWGRLNRSSLLRVPLAFRTRERLDRAMNPREAGAYPTDLARPTIEYRSPDGSAFPHLLLAAIAQVLRDALNSDDALEMARRLEIGHDLHGADAASPSTYDQLPATAVEAAAVLRSHRAFFEERGMPPRLLDAVLTKLEAEMDSGLAERLRALPAGERLAESRRLMHKDLHKH